MKEIICAIAFITAMGTSVLLTGCEKKSTVAIKNDFPQKFVYVYGELMSNAEFNINEAIIVDEVQNNVVEIILKGEMVERNLLADLLLCSCELDYKVYDSNGKEIECDSPDKKHTIGIRSNIRGEIDDTVKVYLGSKVDDYTIEFLETSHE